MNPLQKYAPKSQARMIVKKYVSYVSLEGVNYISLPHFEALLVSNRQTYPIASREHRLRL